MVATIARKEFTGLMRDGRFRLAAGIVGLLIVAALLTGWGEWQTASRLHAEARNVTRAEWLAQPAKNGHRAAHYGIYAFRPEPPLSFVDRGVTSYLGTYTWLEAHRQNAFRARPAQDATDAARFGEWSAAAALQLLVPLIIVVLVAPAFAGERDTGTLRQLVSLGVPTRQLALGKAAGIAGGLGLLLVPAALIGAAALVLAGPVDSLAAASGATSTGADTALRVAMLAAGYLLYFVIFTGVSLAVSARARSMRGALATLLAIWTVNALGAAPLAASIVRALHPTPSAFQFNADIEHDIGAAPEGMSVDDRARQFQDSVVRAFGVASVDSLPVNFAALRLAEGERHGNAIFDARYGRLAENWRAQDGLRTIASVVAPVLAIRSLSMALAGTDAEQQVDFQEAAEQYRRLLVNTMNAVVLVESRTADGLTKKADPSHWAAIPPFQYVAPDAAWVLARQARNLAVLLLWAAVASVIAWGCTRRLPVDAMQPS